MWDIELRQRGWKDGIETQEKLSQFHHELFRVNQSKILDRYWRRVRHKISHRDDAREVARKKFYYEDFDTVPLQLEGPSVRPLNIGRLSSGEGVSCEQLQIRRNFEIPLDTNNCGIDKLSVSIARSDGLTNGDTLTAYNHGVYEQRAGL